MDLQSDADLVCYQIILSYLLGDCEDCAILTGILLQKMNSCVEASASYRMCTLGIRSIKAIRSSNYVEFFSCFDEPESLETSKCAALFLLRCLLCEFAEFMRRSALATMKKAYSKIEKISLDELSCLLRCKSSASMAELCAVSGLKLGTITAETADRLTFVQFCAEDALDATDMHRYVSAQASINASESHGWHKDAHLIASPPLGYEDLLHSIFCKH